MLDFTKLSNFFYFTLRNIRDFVLDLFSVFYVRMFFIITVGVNILVWFVAVFINKSVAEGDLLVLHYNVDFGVNLIGLAEEIYAMPIMGVLIILFNYFFVGMTRKENNFLAYLLLAGALIFNSIIFIGIGYMYLINFK